mgnify:CR=1 FL=1
MACESVTNRRHSSKRSIGLVSLLILTSIGGIIATPSAAASVSGDYEITASVSPLPGDYMSAWDPVYMEVEITNSGFFYNTQPRSVEWFVCEGNQLENDCYNNREGYGIGSIDPIIVGESVTYSFSNYFSPNGDEGLYTLVYRFIDSDTNTTNDAGIYNFNLVRKLVDVIFEEQDILGQLEGLASYNDVLILNTDTDYVTSVEGIAKSCGSCGLVANLGWKITDNFGVELANATTSYTDLPNWGESSFTRNLPPINFDTEGVFTLYYGIISSTGTPSGDMNSYNDLQSLEITFDDTVDLQIESMHPSYAPSSAVYYYGNNSVSVSVANLGNHTVVEPLVRFTILTLDENIESQQDCLPEEIIPGESYVCNFNLNALGDKRLRVFVSEALNEGLDQKPSDNTLNVISEVVRGEINPIIEQTNFFGTYKTADNIDLNARVNPTAAAPLSYTWWMSGIIPIGAGQNVSIPASTLGLGDHYLTVRATDALGTLESETIPITIFNSTDISIGNWLNGSAVTRTHATAIAEYDYPLVGANYAVGENLEPLLRMSIDVIPTTNAPDAGMDWMEFDINLTNVIPDNIPRESIAVHKLNGYEQVIWEPLDSENFFQVIDNDTLRVNITQNMDLIIVGDLPSPEIDLDNPILTLLPDGKMKLDWNSSGDLSTPYFGGWKIFRVTSPVTVSAYFPNPDDVPSRFVWEGLMKDSLSATLNGTMNSWIDERSLETGICASYAVIPTDRAGNPDYLEAEVSLVDGVPGLTCGDAIDPTASVTGLKSNVVYTNDSDCHAANRNWDMCYELTLSWTWPDNEPSGDLSWNIYRIEQKPEDVDLRFVTPIATGLQNVPGEQGNFTQTGLEYDGIRPYRTYYYILTPIDNIGNELTTIGGSSSSNVHRVYIEDQYWQYNQHRIPEPPEPPEPPYGIEWLGDLEDFMEQENFQLAGIILLVTIVVNFIGLPIILKKRKRMARALSRRKNRQAENLDDDFEDFFN